MTQGKTGTNWLGEDLRANSRCGDRYKDCIYPVCWNTGKGDMATRKGRWSGKVVVEWQE